MASIRDEGTCDIGGMTINLKVTWETLIDIEERSGLDLVTLAGQYQEKRLSFKSACVVVHACAKSAGDKRTFDHFAKLLLAAGYFKPYVQAMALVTTAVTAGIKETQSGVPEEGAAPPKETPNA